MEVKKLSWNDNGVSELLDFSKRFYEAVRENRVEEVRRLLGAQWGRLRPGKAAINECFKQTGLYPLSTCIQSGNADMFTLLLDDGADVDAEDAKGRRPLWHAITAGRVEMVRALLSYGASIEKNYLHQCICVWIDDANTTNAMIGALLDCGAVIDERVDITNGKRALAWTPLEYALAGGRDEVVSFLLSRGAAAPTDALLFHDVASFLRFSLETIVRLVCEKGANVDAESSVLRPSQVAVGTYIEGAQFLRDGKRRHMQKHLETECDVLLLLGTLMRLGANFSACSAKRTGYRSALCLAAVGVDPLAESHHAKVRRRRALIDFLIRSCPHTSDWFDTNAVLTSELTDVGLVQSRNKHEDAGDSKLLHLAQAGDIESLHLLLRVHRAEQLLERESWLERPSVPGVDAPVLAWLRATRDDARSTPPSLQFLVRRALRRHYGLDADRVFRDDRQASVLPQRLRDYLLLNEL